MIAVSTNLSVNKTRKVFCPECRSRICDLLLPEQQGCAHKYKIVIDHKAQALSVLGEMKMILPVRSELFTQVVCLSDKLEKEKIDYFYEMSAVGLSDEKVI